MDKSWKEGFPARILERGSTYYQLGMVKKLLHRGQEISAEVEGTRNYQVSIRFNDGFPAEATCTCPYASDGAKCKHQAAVLFAVEDLGYDFAPDPEDVRWEQALEALPERTLRVMVRNLAENNPELQQMLLLLHKHTRESR